MHLYPDGSLLVSAAGGGDPAAPLTGSLLKLRDNNADGDFDDDAERTTLLGEQPSKNILAMVRRDEVFGMAGMDEGDGTVLVALAFFGGPSTLFRVDAERVEKYSDVHGNINDLTYDPTRDAWFGASSTSDEVVRLQPQRGSERVIKLSSLESGQDAVPGYIEHDPLTGDLLVSLFSGSPQGEEGGDGTEIVLRSARIVRVNPDRKQVEPFVVGLTVPTDLAIAADGSLYVLEFCDAFLDPVGTREAMSAGPSHGGFRRFSGRLLRIDRGSGRVEVIAQGLDAPTNLELRGKALYVAEGMGTPGRLIPGPTGAPQPLTGFIECIDLP